MTASEPRIAAVIPAYNAAGVLGDAIASLQRQTVPPDEILVVDDGSADDTAAVAEAAGARVIRQANGGPAAARNAGIEATTAEWIALLDSDDLAYPTRLEREREHLSDPATAVVFSGAIVPGRLRPPTDAVTFASLWQQNQIITSTVLLRRAAWSALGGFDEARELIGVEDYNLWLRLAHAGWQFSQVADQLVEYRPGAASLTAQTRRFAAAEMANIRRIAERLQLDAGTVQAKEHAVYLNYAFDFFHARDLPAARDFFREAARRGPLPLAARIRLMATVLPLRRRNAR
ncbi:MAG TPA: glycosyltransferase family A protein [Gemmatimonadales bacterium]|jgi:glycosyltransferase involved in cell wall biosynthesis|nr:glycosyltransferase family A protein [Gemmatimonadales bacterium]